MKAIRLAWVCVLAAGTGWAQGLLTPPGPPDDSTMKTLDQLWEAIRVAQAQITDLQAQLVATSNGLVEAHAALAQEMSSGFVAAGTERSQMHAIVTDQLSAFSNATYLSMAQLSNQQASVQASVGSVSNRLGRMIAAQYTAVGSLCVTSTVLNGAVDDAFQGALLAFGPDGKPVVASRYNPGNLIYLCCYDGNGRWNPETIDTVLSSTGGSLAFTPDGRPAISYEDSFNRDLRYAVRNGATWDVQIVDNGDTMNHGWWSSLAFSPAGHPAISYYDSLNQDLKYAAWNGSSWQFQTVDSAGNVGWYTSLKFSREGRPAISYHDYTNRDLKYAAWNGTSWVVQTVDGAGEVGTGTSLAFSPAGHPAIGYCDDTNDQLKSAVWNGSSWEIQTVGRSESTGFGPGIAFAPDGSLAVGYVDRVGWAIRYATRSGSGWSSMYVDMIDPETVPMATLAFTPAGNPAIAFTRSRSVRYAEIITRP